MIQIREKEKKLFFGAAYYDEYMPVERLEKDMKMMQEAGMNVIRIAESTWSTEEPQEGIFDFSHLKRVIEAAGKYGITVIVGTPTYAIPPWLAYKYPDILVTTEEGTAKYGFRQNMDITNPHYLFHAERIIRKLLECVKDYPNVIGYQIDNETKHYHTAGAGVQKRFIDYLQKKFSSVEEMNRVFGLAYWSNRVDSWEHFPDVTGTINASLAGEFEKFRRKLVDDFLQWQRDIVDEYRREDQFVTHNFDFEWRGYSFGVQPDVNHFHGAKAVTIAGCDIYHPTQDLLTGKEAAFCGAITRALKKDNYLVMETQAQGHVSWTPYEGQLRMQAFAHIANGANGVLYWHWHSIHNGMETYWRGLLSHDLQENRLYREAGTIGADFGRLSGQLLNLKKKNKVAILVSNDSLTALSHFPFFPVDAGVGYNDVVRQYADALYEWNVEYDILSDETEDFSAYQMVLVPVLYSARGALLKALETYVQQGGHLVVSFKSGYADENLSVYPSCQPHVLGRCLGISYQEYTVPVDVQLQGKADGLEPYTRDLSEKEKAVFHWMELIQPKEARILAGYQHPYWGKYAAVTENIFGKGTAYYVGCHTSDAFLRRLLKYCLDRVPGMPRDLPTFPIHVHTCFETTNRKVYFIFNYSKSVQRIVYPFEKGISLLSGKEVQAKCNLELAPWGVDIIENIEQE